MKISDNLTPLITAFAAITSTIIGVTNFRSARRRLKLKDDLEILKKLKEEFGNESTKKANFYDAIEKKIDKHLHKTYIVKGIDLSDFFTAITFFILAFLPFAIFDSDKVYTWGIPLSIASATVCVIFIYYAFNDRNNAR
jgi:hypothetical protein